MKRTTVFRIFSWMIAAFLLVAAVGPGFSGEIKSSPKTIRSPLAKQARQVDPDFMVVYIRADWCPACKAMKNNWFAVREKYKGRVKFVTLDVTDRHKSAFSAQKAQSLGISDFYEQNKARTSTVAIMKLPSKKIVKTYWNEPSIEAYSSVIDPLLASN